MAPSPPSIHPSVMDFLPRFGNGFGEPQAVQGSPQCCGRGGSAPEGWDVLGSCCLQLFSFSSGCFGSKKQLLGAPGAELEVVGTEGGRLGACKAVGSSPSARSFVTQSEQGEGFGGTQTPWVAAGLDPDGASLFPQHQAVSGSVHAAESPGSPGCSGWADLWPAQWWLEDEEEQQELLGRSPGAVTLARCSAARGPGTAAGAGGGRRGTAPAAVKRRYGLERHQQGSAWSIGSHRRGARAGRSLRGQILLPGTEWVTFTWPPARPEVGEGGFHVRKAPRGSTSLAVQVAGCRSLRAPAPSPSGGMDDFLGAQNPAKGSLLQDGEVPPSCSSPRQCPEGKLGHQESPRRVREAMHLQGGCRSGCGGCTCWCSGFWADVGAQGAHPWLMTTLARRCSPWSMRTARTGASPAWMRGWRTSSPRGSSARSCSKLGGVAAAPRRVPAPIRGHALGPGS